MEDQNHNDDGTSQLLHNELRDDPPPYLPAEATADINSLQVMTDRLLPSSQELHILEDARRDLALMFPYTDIPQAARFKEANAWIVEKTEWFAEAWRSIGCATHEMTIPPLVAYNIGEMRDPALILWQYDHKTFASAKAKAEAALAIQRGAKAVIATQARIGENSTGFVHIEAADKIFQADTVRITAEAIATLYQDAVPLVIAKCGQPGDRSIPAYLTIELSSVAIASAAMHTAMRHLWIAGRAPEHGADAAIQETVRALAVALTAASIAAESGEARERLEKAKQLEKQKEPHSRLVEVVPDCILTLFGKRPMQSQ